MHRRTWRSRRILVLLTAGMLTGYAVTVAAPPSAPTGTIALAASHGGNPPPRDVNCTGCVDTADIADGAVTDAKLATTGLDASRLTVGTLDPALLGTGIDAAKITIGYLSTGRIQDGGILSRKLADASNDPLAPTGIITAKIENGNVTTEKLAGGAVTTGRLADGAVTNDKLSAAAVDSSRLADDAVTTGKLHAQAVKTAQLGDLAVTNAKLAAAAVDASKLADGAVTTTKLDLAAVKTAQLDDLAVTNAKLAAAAVGTAQLVDDAVTSTKLAAAAVDTAQLANGAVTIDKLATAAVGTQQLANGAVTTGKLAIGAVDSDRLANGAVMTGKLADGAVTPVKMTSNAAIGTNPSGVSLTSGAAATTVAVAVLNQADPAPHTGLVTGQVVVRCVCPTATRANVRYDIVRTDTSGTPHVVGGMSYTVLLGDGTDNVLPISLIDTQIPLGQNSYALRAEALDLSGADTVTFHSAVVNVVDLGR